MIVSKLQGGLGNQLFQWAYALNLSIEHKTTFFIDISSYNNQIGITQRSFSLNKFKNLNLNIYDGQKINPLVTISDDFNYKNFLYYEFLNYYLNGYWQSEKYFKANEKTIKKELSINEDDKLKILSKYPQLEKNSISLHIRRTDYVNQQHNHPVQTIEYYKNALDFIGEYNYLLIFSDDINWCKENLQFSNMIFIENNDEITDMQIMSLCKNNIIANSSFSWWGAWLNNNPNKKVIAPTKWFGESLNLNTSDIIPDNWIKL
jgi:hypothetical protein